MHELIEVIKVSKHFGGVKALEQVDLTIRPKEIIGLIGPNGSGKTTLLNVISGVFPPTQGEIYIDGVNVTGWPLDKIAHLKIARTFQHIRLFGNLTVLENVEVGTAIQRGNNDSMSLRKYAMAAIEEVGLHSDLYRNASTLDYGAQRKLEIARALVTCPRYLFLDEPAAGMNEAETDELLKNLKYILDIHGMGILIIDHDISLIMRICDRITVLNEGRVICDGPPIKIQTDPIVAEAYLGRMQTQNS